MNHATVVWRPVDPGNHYVPWEPGHPAPDQRSVPIEWAVRVGDPSLVSSYTEPMTWSQAHNICDLVNRAHKRGWADARHEMRSALGL